MKWTDEELGEALRKGDGLISFAARLTGCPAEQIRRRLHRSPDLREIVREAREALVDVCESRLKRLALDGDFRAIALALKTIGKDRGYVERVETREISDEALEKEIERERAKGG